MSLSTVTRASLGVRALQRANLQFSTFIEAAELNGLVDTSMAKMYNLLVGMYQDYFVTQTDYVLDPLAASYALPSDYFKTRHVAVVDASGNVYPPLDWLELVEISSFSYNPVDGGLPTGYNIRDGQLYVYPIGSTFNGSLRLFYIPEYVPPVSDTDQIKLAVAYGWDEWVVNDIAIQIRNKAMMPAQELMAERQMIEQRLIHEASKRQSGRPRRVADTGWGRIGWGRRGDFSRR